MKRQQISSAFWAGKRVLVTGHTGFKGSWLSLWLSELGALVSGLSLEPDTQPSLFHQLQLETRFQHHWIADIRDRSVVSTAVETSQPQVVLHLAAQPLVRLGYRDPLGTWATNVQGSLHVMEALRPLGHSCAVVMVTTDKVYENQEWDYGYREVDRLGGHDPYSASKAAAELAISSWRSSFCGSAAHQTSHLAIATARAGNVIGGGDWAIDRIVPDAIRALEKGAPVTVRNSAATRPWQHVLEPLSGYLRLAEALTTEAEPPCGPFNFGPQSDSNQPVHTLVNSILSYWPGTWRDQSDPQAPHEAGLLQLDISKARMQLGWEPCWDFATAVKRTVAWYRAVQQGASPLNTCKSDLEAYTSTLWPIELPPP